MDKQGIKDRCGAIVGHTGLADNCARKALDIIDKHLMPYTMKKRADALINDIRGCLKDIEKERKKIYELLNEGEK